MGVVYFLVPISILLAFFGLLGFVWAVRKGQFDELETPALRILFEEQSEQVDSSKGNSKSDE